MPKVWFVEADQRAGRYEFRVRTTHDGMESQFIRRDMSTDVEAKHTFTGEASCQAAMRRFMDEVTAEIYLR